MNDLDLLKNYIDINVAPILTTDIPIDIYKKAIVLPANCSDLLLTGYYNKANYISPTWLEVVKERSKIGQSILIIENISSISKDEQMKFYELFKYRKISNFALPSNSVIIVTAKNVDNNSINSTIYSLLVHI